MANCKSCGAPITWAKTERGRRMPLEHSDEGNIALRGGRVRFIVSGEVQHPGGTSALRADEPRFVSHFATCPQAAAHRKAKTDA